MSNVASRELRNDTAGVLRRVQAGEEIVITVNGRPAAQLIPVQAGGRRWLRRDELTRRLSGAQADPGLRGDLARLAGETTDDLPEVR
jgi:prevent-host-death family protein